MLGSLKKCYTLWYTVYDSNLFDRTIMNNPFDDDDLGTPPPLPDDKKKEEYKFPSAVGYETVPENWKPRAGKELPALRCAHIRDDGSRCRNFGVRGTGFGGTKSMCFIHGGSLPQVKAKAEAMLLTARMRLVENTGMALDTLFDLTKPGTADQIRLKASTEILDRAGIKGGIDLNIEVNHNISAADQIRDRLQSIRSTVEPESQEDDEEILDAEVVDNEDDKE